MPDGDCALAISKGLDCNRAVDESGNQIAVFGRVGAHPLNLEDQHKLYLREKTLWMVSDDPDDAIYDWRAPMRQAASEK